MTQPDSRPAFLVPPAYPAWIQPPGGRWWVPESGNGPEFQVQEVAKTFFARSGSCMRMQPSDQHPAGWFTNDDGTAMEYKRVTGQAEDYSFRLFTLDIVERMLWSYYEHESRDSVDWYTSLAADSMPVIRAEQRMARYQSRMTDATSRLRYGIEIVKWIGRQYGIVAPVVVQKTDAASAGEWGRP
jgi:hypothetical protein